MHASMGQELGARPDRQNKPELVGCAEASPDPSLRLRVRGLADSSFEFVKLDLWRDQTLLTEQFVMKRFGVQGCAMNPALEGRDGRFDIRQPRYSLEAHAFQDTIEGLLNILSWGVQSKECGVAANTEFVIACGALQILDALLYAMAAMPDQFMFVRVRLVVELAFDIRTSKAVGIDSFGTSPLTTGWFNAIGPWVHLWNYRCCGLRRMQRFH